MSYRQEDLLWNTVLDFSKDDSGDGTDLELKKYVKSGELNCFVEYESD